MSIHPTAIVETGAELGEGIEIGPYSVVHAGTRLGENVRLLSHVVVHRGADIGARTIVHPFAVVSGPPQHMGYKDEPTRLQIGPDCVIREHAALHRGTVMGGGVTRIGARCFIMSGSHVGHDCHLDDDVVLASNAGLGGHVVVGKGVFLGGLAAVHQFCRIGDYAMVGGGAAVSLDVIPYGSAVGNHATLEGLNIIGMKRRGVTREAIHDVRRAYRMLFESEGLFEDRLAEAERTFGARAEVARILDFIKADAKRAVMAPKR